MSRICIAALLVTLSGASVGFSYEVSGSSPGVAVPMSGEPWNVPNPSGLRFGGDVVQVRTGDVEGSASCDSCGAGCCMHWAYLPWYGGGNYGHVGDGHHGCKACSR